MKYALVSGDKVEATKGVEGLCPSCDSVLIAKCGEVKIHHWAHKGKRNCDPWWENETEWHRAWKNQFPESWQEVIHRSDNGEKHIADVKTDQGWVIEFQHSYIKPEELRSRDTFYKKLAWVVDGTRRKRDGEQLLTALKKGILTGPNSPIHRVFSNKCALLREWSNCQAPVFFDFGGDQVLWWLLKGAPDGSAYIGRFSRSEFIEIHRGGVSQKSRDFEEYVKDLGRVVSQFESHLRAQARKQSRPRLTQGIQQYQIRRGRLRRRF